MPTPVANSVPVTADHRIDALIEGGSWQFEGTRTLTYAIHDFGFSEQATREAVAAAFSAWSAVANITFQQIFEGVDPEAPETSPADMAVALTGDLLQFTIDAVGIACFPDPAFADQTFLPFFSYLWEFPVTRTDYRRPEGDVYIDDFVFTPFLPGTDSFHTIVHEIGHALGLSHPNGNDVEPGYDHLSTIMSGNPVPDSTFEAGNPATPMPFDILAIQHIYGANLSYRTGNDTYALSDDGIVRTIWDAGGNDTLDASGLNFGVTIDLRPGQLTAHGSLGSRTAIAFNVTIENATGTAFDDALIGNDAANILIGGAGNDRVDGGGGVDTAVFSGLRANYTTSPHDSGFDLTDRAGPGGTDFVAGVERLRFSDGALAFDLGANQAADNTVRIIGAAFDAPTIQQHPEWVGLGLQFFDGGASVLQVCTQVAQLMGLGNAAFVTQVYTNIVGVAPDAATRDSFVGLLQGNGGQMTQGQLLEFGATIDLNAINIDLVGLQQSGVEFA